MSIENCKNSLPEEIILPKPDLNKSVTLLEALKNRHSVREYDTAPLALGDLSNLLWAADGINRPDGHHTAATALNKKDIDIYVLLPQASYIYNPTRQSLKLVAEGDARDAMHGWQVDFPMAPAFILMVSYPERFGVPDRRQAELMGAVDAGIVSQNIMLYCAANGLVTVPRYSMDREALAKMLHLSEDAMPVINNPVGYPVK